jgi:DNA-binding LytR/AlgR family response regulator
MIIRCIALDDEPLALMQLSSFIEKTPGLELTASCNSAFKAIEIVNDQEVDLIFADIQMPDLNGIDFSRALDKRIKVIFTTAYAEYALEGFKVDALDYLLKPFGYEQFLVSANKAKAFFDMKEKAETIVEQKHDFLFVKSEYKLVKIKLSDIRYIEGLKDYVKIYTQEPKPILSLLTMKLLEEKLPADSFMRVHRSYIVNLNNMTIIERGNIVFGDLRISVSDKYKEPFERFIRKKFV